MKSLNNKFLLNTGDSSVMMPARKKIKQHDEEKMGST
ncbi:EamA family transporter, partial [Salmonella enterica]|nr:EamA family transporter [Salmonella enterica]